MSLVSAQSASESCDPYFLDESSFSVSPNDLNAPADSTLDAHTMRQIGINPDVLMELADSMSGSDFETTTSANPETGLAPSEYAIVTREGEPLTIYEGTCTESHVLMQLRSGSRVTVLDGPVAAEGYAWWRVRRSDVTGWAIEGTDSEIWLHSIS